MPRALGRKVPTDWEHVEKHPFVSSVYPAVERQLQLPYWHPKWDQGSYGACVGFGTTMMDTILNLEQRKDANLKGIPRYDPFWLWSHAKAIDDFPDTNPGDNEGTTVRAACDILRTTGPRVLAARGIQFPPTSPAPGSYDFPGTPGEGIAENKWAKTVDDMRAAISVGVPISIGVNWYRQMSEPTQRGAQFWIYANGPLEGGHCVCVRGASDKLQAFSVKNNWLGYPLVLLPYSEMEKLLAQDGEACLVTDK